MTVLASQWINWDALWKIILAALIGGSGVVIVFGILLLGLRYARGAQHEGRRLAGWALAGACGVFCVGAVVVGIVAMADKPASKAKKAHHQAAKSAQGLPTRQPPGRPAA
jgi:biotin transporter BioY